MARAAQDHPYRAGHRLAAGAVGPAKPWPLEAFAALASRLGRSGWTVRVLVVSERAMAAAILGASGAAGRDLTGSDLREAILALAAARAAVSNDSGLLHVAAALGTPAIGIFGPTSPWHWAPLNPLAATLEPATQFACRPCHKPICAMGDHRCMRNITERHVYEAVRAACA